MADRDQDFEQFFRVEYAGVVRVVYALTGDRATSEDVTQDAFARLYAHWKKVSRYERPQAWVRRVAINRALSGLRRRPRAAAPIPAPDPIDPDLHRAILSLPRNQRAAIILHYFNDSPIAEIAAALGCSAGTVKAHLYRARAKLGAALALEVDDEA